MFSQAGRERGSVHRGQLIGRQRVRRANGRKLDVAGLEVEQDGAHGRVSSLADLNLLVVELGRVLLRRRAAHPVVLDEKGVRLIVRVLPVNAQIGAFRSRERLLLGGATRSALAFRPPERNRLCRAGREKSLVVTGSFAEEVRRRPQFELAAASLSEEQPYVHHWRVQKIWDAVISQRSAPGNDPGEDSAHPQAAEPSSGQT